MNVLMVYAHPEPRSFTGHLKDHAWYELQNLGHYVKVTDIFATLLPKLDPSGDFREPLEPTYFDYQTEQVHAELTKTIIPAIAAEQEKVRWADTILFIYPLWWDSIPGVLKTWVEKVFSMGFAYGPEWKFSEGPLKGKTAMSIISVAGSHKVYRANSLRGDLDQLLFPFHHGTLFALGFRVLPPFIAWGSKYASDVTRAKYLEDLEVRLRALADTEPIKYHPLTDYNEDLVLREEVPVARSLHPSEVMCLGCGSMIPWGTDYCVDCQGEDKSEDKPAKENVVNVEAK